MTTKPPREKPAYVTVQLPRCPDCGSAKLITRHTGKDGDGALLRYARCECGRRIVLIVQ